jgi:hypothetical protein
MMAGNPDTAIAGPAARMVLVSPANSHSRSGRTRQPPDANSGPMRPRQIEPYNCNQALFGTLMVLLPMRHASHVANPRR